ncbi:MAG: hypothetical protein L0387_39630 [Acidobacteria bacterium]|nr:hypothetical protein [Acidobacteriota bacterium]
MSEEKQAGSLGDLYTDLHLRWIAWLRLRHRSLAHVHTEIVQDATTDLIQYLSEHKNQAHSDEDIRRIGFTILRRRVADEFRARTVQWAEDFPLDELPSTDPSSNPEEVLRYASLLRAVTGLIARLNKPSRELLLRVEAGTDAAEVALSDAERQRLSRLRAELRRQLAETYGIDIKQFLRE